MREERVVSASREDKHSSRSEHCMSLPSIGNILLAPQRKRRDSITSTDMDLNNLLNTNRSRSAAGYRNMQYEVPIPLNMNHDMSHNTPYNQNLFVPNGNSRIKSEAGSERGVSPHNSEHSSRYSSQTPQNSMAYQQMASQLGASMQRYPSPSQMQQSNNMGMLQHSYHPNAAPEQQYQQQAQAQVQVQAQAQAQMGAVQQPVQQEQSPMEGGRQSTGSTGLPKAFACSTCRKGFARRSDLARHGKHEISHLTS